MKTSELLEKAQAAIIKRGWVKNLLRDGADGPVCAVGALILARDGKVPRAAMEVDANDLYPATEALAVANGLGYMAPTGWRGWSAVVEFNNDRDTDLGDVLQAFDAAIAYARAQEGEP